MNHPRFVRRVVISALALLPLLPFAARAASADGSASSFDLDAAFTAVEPDVITWRRDFHQHPELGNREFRTSAKIAEHLRSLGIEVTTGVAHTGVVGLLVGGKPGPVVALRADMDGLPVNERVPLDFASTAKGTYNGNEVDVMHACGHDTHMAILMGVATVLSQIREDLPGTVKFLFQPAEEGAPEGEEGGAELMVKEGVLENPHVDVAFGLHIASYRDVGTISYRSGGTMASADDFRITVNGKQSHGSQPWNGHDPVAAAAQIVSALQTIVSREVDLTQNPAVVTVGSIHGGVRSNIIPEQVEMVGTIRTLSPEDRDHIHAALRRIAVGVGESLGVSVDVQVPFTTAYPVTYNDPALVEQMLSSLRAETGDDKVLWIPPITGAEDFSFFAQKVPGFYFFLGGKPLEVAPEDAPPHHTPDFAIDESGLLLGVRALTRLTLDYLTESGSRLKNRSAAGSGR